MPGMHYGEIIWMLHETRINCRTTSDRRLVQSRFEVIHGLLADEVGIGAVVGFYEGFVLAQKDKKNKAIIKPQDLIII